MMLAYIPDDGYSEKFYIESVPGLFPAVRGEFRLAGVATRAKHREVSRRLTEEQYDEKGAELMAAKLDSWNIEGLDCHKKADVLKLKPLLFVKLYAIIVGDVPSDTDPEWTEAERQRYEGKTGEVIQEADRGN